MEHQQIFDHIFNNISDLCENEKVPVIILLLAQYQLSASQVVNQEINTMALIVELMNEGGWK